MRSLLPLLIALACSRPSLADNKHHQLRYQLKQKAEQVRRVFDSSVSTAQKRSSLAGLVHSIRAARGHVPASVMESYRKMSGEAFRLKHGRSQPPRFLSLPHYVHGYPRSVKIKEIQRLVQQMVTQTYGSGFRQLGADVDFSHGHIVFAPERSRRLPPRRSAAMVKREVDRDYPLKPVAVLYHTQEFAHDATKKGDLKNGYVNPRKRNWLQDWATGKVEDATRWVKPGEKMNDHFTLFEWQLDAGRLGAATKMVNNGTLERLADTFQFQFHRIDPQKKNPNRNDQFTVRMPDGRNVLLQLSSNLTRHLKNPYK